ncbi:uncharacterized protein LOC144882863 [Branchiostoma floridae x Branchiostoma japonicum]
MAETSRYDLFLEISQNLNKTECRDLRTYVGSKRLLPGRDLQDMDPQQIFVKLEHKGKLKTGDLSLVVDLMIKIERDDFAREAKRIAAQEEKALKLKSKSDSSDEELPDSPAKRSRLPRQSAKDESTVDVSSYFGKVIKGASHNWDGLAEKLGFTPNEIKNIKTDYPDQDRRCREMLNRWRNKHGRKATLQVLKDALINIDEERTADELEDPPKPRLQTRKEKEAEPEAGRDLEAPDDEGDGKIGVKVKACDEDLWEKIMNEVC